MNCETTVKEFLKLPRDPHGFAEDFHIVVQTSQSGFSDLYQIVYVLVGESQANTGCIAPWEHPGGDLEVQIPDFWQEVGTLDETSTSGNSSSLS